MTILTKQHIETLVKHFYQQVQHDTLLGPIFNDIAQVNWEAHIPLICRFWCTVMLGTDEYEGGAYPKHVAIGKKTLITDQHFARWLELFTEQANTHLSQAAAQEIIKRAHMIARGLKMGMIKLEDE